MTAEVNVVTGGAGFIGSHLVQLLCQHGEKVRVVERPGAAVEHLPAEAEVHFADIRDRSSLRTAFEGARRVYHLAANPNLWTRERADFDAVNHQGTVNVLQQALQAGAERVLHTSTESILTSRRFQGGAVETLQLREEDMVGPYCLSKFLAEQAAFALAEQGKPVIVVNPTLPIGPGDRGMSPPTRMTVDFCRGKLPAYLDCRFNMIDARDVALGMIAAMERGRPGKRYLLGNRNLRLHEWLRMVGERIGRPAPRWQVPYIVALAAGYCGEFLADHVTHRMPNATTTGVRLTRYCMHFDPTNSLQELGLTPRPLEESLTDALAFYREMSWISGR